MAEQERKTKAERRAEARAERKRAEEEAARRAKQQNIRNGVIAVAVIAVLAVVLIPTIQNLLSGGGDNEVTISQEAALEARQTAGCEMVVDGQPLEDSTHHDPATAPPADVLYASSEVRPTHSGPHFAQTQQAIGGVPGDPLDERATTHNLEHGAIIAWFDPDEVEDSTVSEMESWMQARQDLGFESQAGGNIFVSPYPEMTGDKPIAIRAWGFALNCDEWNQDVADAMIIDYWGTHGRAPERNLSPYPTGALGYAEDGAEVEDNTEAPIENESDGGAADTATEGGTAPESASGTGTEG